MQINLDQFEALPEPKARHQQCCLPDLEPLKHQVAKLQQEKNVLMQRVLDLQSQQSCDLQLQLDLKQTKDHLAAQQKQSQQLRRLLSERAEMQQLERTVQDLVGMLISKN